MPLEYKPNFTSASGGGGFVTGYHGTPDSFTQQKAPDFEGAMKTLAGAVEDFRDSAFEQGKLDQIAGEIDSNKILFKDAYLAGAEYATSFQKMAEFQAFVADESNKALGRGESAEEFYARISPKISEYRDSYTRIKQVNPEAGTLLTNNLMNIATGALQQYGVNKLQRTYEHIRAGSVTTAVSALMSPLQSSNATADTLVGAVRQSMYALQEDAKRMGLNPTEYVSDILTVAAKQVAMGFNFNEPMHRTWVNTLQSTVRKLVDGGIIDRTKSIELLSLLQTKVKEGTTVGVQKLRLNAQEAARAGKYTTEQYSLDRAVILQSEASGVSPALISESLNDLEKAYQTNNKNSNILRTVPATTKEATEQATAFGKSVSALPPSQRVDKLIAATKETKNPKLADQILPPLVTSAVSLLSSKKTEKEFLPSDYEVLGAIAKADSDLSTVCDRATMYGDKDFSSFMMNKSNRDLLQKAGTGSQEERANAVSELRSRYALFKTAIGHTIEPKELKIVSDDLYWFVPTFWETELKESSNADVDLVLLNQAVPDVIQDAKRQGISIVDHEGVVSALQNCRVVADNGLTITANQYLKSAIPEAFESGVDGNVVLGNALTNILYAKGITANRDVNGFQLFFDAKLGKWLLYDNEVVPNPKNIMPIGSFEHEEVLESIKQSVRATRINDQEELANRVKGVAYSNFKDDSPTPTYKVVDTNMGKVGVISTNGFTASVMFQGLRQAVKEGIAPESAKKIAYAEIDKAIALGTAFKDDTKLRQAVKACTGMNYDRLVTNILKPSKFEGNNEVFTPKSEEAADFVSSYYADKIIQNAGSAGVSAVLWNSEVLNAKALGELTEFIMENSASPTNFWGETNLVSNPDSLVLVQHTLENVGRYSADRVDNTIKEVTGKTITQWNDAYKEAKALQTPKTINEPKEMSYKINIDKYTGLDKAIWDKLDPEEQKRLNAIHYKSVRDAIGPFTIYESWNKTAFGDLGTEFAAYLLEDEQFLLDYRNTRSLKNQFNPDLKQVEVISLGVTRGGFPRFNADFEASVGNPEALSRVTADFAQYYFSNMTSKMSAYGFDITEFRNKPQLKSALFALGSFLWHSGRGKNAYLEAMVKAKTDLAGAYAMFKRTSAYQESGGARQEKYLNGLKAVADYFS